MDSGFSKPRLLVLGGSGRTGQLLIAEALKRGHSVTALVRNSISLPARSGLLSVQGTPMNQEDVKRAMLASSDTPTVIISTLGQTRKSGNPWSATTSPPRMMADSISNAFEVSKNHNIQKIVVMSMFGAGKSFDNLNFLLRLTMCYSNMAQTLEDQNLVDETVKSSGINFVLARPAMLKGEEVLQVKDLGDAGEKAGFMPSVSASSVVQFLLDAAASDEWDGRTPVLSN